MHHITEIEHSALYQESFRKLKIGHCMIHKLIKRGCKKTPHKKTDKSGECQFIGLFLTVRLAAHVSNGLKSRIRPVVGRI